MRISRLHVHSARQCGKRKLRRGWGRGAVERRPRRYTDQEREYWTYHFGSFLRLNTLDDFKYRLGTKHKGYYSQSFRPTWKENLCARKHGQTRNTTQPMRNALGTAMESTVLSRCTSLSAACLVRYHYAAPNGLHNGVSWLVDSLDGG